MVSKTKYILAVAGVIAAVTGIMIGIPAFLQGQPTAGVLATMLMVGGIIILAISFAD